MHDLLPFYERELAFLRQRSREFGARYPKIAARLLLSGDACEDPHVERLIESFALLSARVQKKLEDDYPELTSAFLDVLYPHYLRPVPSCSIAHFDLGGKVAQMSGPSVVARGTVLTTRPVKGVACKFRTAFDVSLTPLKVAEVSYREAFSPPRGYPLPPGAASLLSVRIDSGSAQTGIDALKLDRLRLFVDGEPTLVTQLREAMLTHALGVALEVGDTLRWEALRAPVVRAAGFSSDEPLFDYDARSHLAYRLLSEFFAFPEKFNFIDIDLAALRASLPAGTRTFRLHFVLPSDRHGHRDSRLMARVSADNLLCHCTPVVNLFRHPAEPIRVTHTRSSYTLVPDARRAQAFEVYAVERVTQVEKTQETESLHTYHPYYALRHGASLASEGRFWHLRRDEALATLSPGFEYELGIVDVGFDAERERTETLSIELTCTNRDLPSQLPFGLPEGDLFLEGGSLAQRITLLRKPTPTTRMQASAAHWRLISHLSLSQLSLGESGLEALKETLTLYDGNRAAANQRLVDSLKAVRHRVVTVRVGANPYPAFARGIEIEVAVDQHALVGTGFEQLARLLDHFFGLYVHLNSFSRLVVIAHDTGRELIRCAPRNGEQILL